MNRSGASVLRTLATLGGVLAFSAGAALAGEGAVPSGVTSLDHVWVIMMENHAYAQIVNNPSAPFTNQYMKQANAATNYFAVAHPSLTNYLEVVGGSNFGVLNDNSPDWHNFGCTPNIVSGTTGYDIGDSHLRHEQRNEPAIHHLRDQHRRSPLDHGRGRNRRKDHRRSALGAGLELEELPREPAAHRGRQG